MTVRSVAVAQRILVAKDFDPNPFGRKGEWGGESFRARFLIPALERREAIEVVLDGVHGLGPSFLEESFAGLVRLGYLPDLIRQVVTIISHDDPSYIDEAWGYVDEEARRRGSIVASPALSSH
jgi:hypothetical protein